MSHTHCMTKILLLTGLLFASWTPIAAATSFSTLEECQAEAKKQDMEWGQQYVAQAKCHAATASTCPNPAYDQRFDEWVRKINALHNTCNAMRYSVDTNDKGDTRQHALQEPNQQEAPYSSPLAAPYADSDPQRMESTPPSTQQSDASVPAVSANTPRGNTADGDTEVNRTRASTQNAPSISYLQNQTPWETASERSGEPPAIVYLPERTGANAEVISAAPAVTSFCKKVREGEIKYRFFWRTIERQSCYSDGNATKRHDIKCCPDA